ncbi:SRPBCC domain-containing protein [Mucilaginibacter sp. OK098]|uniref:SRPBCC domain-containing protein n=1 Tax=Mucilaginibacter sp. OK098 TaxID=1855297 RepID=UPI000916F008|nr:SRPBCC domain-containing protein [Mucilaginibacter sp. OK098]SHM81889.1 Activator of Hsp90 ATPase homolog 1-like protein [Mucilaginibacter sp. OK098]
MATNISSIIINASTQKVFETLTNPELIKLWQYGRVVTTDWKTGSEIKFRTEGGGKALEQWGTVLEMRTNELIRYNLFTPAPNLEDKMENYCITSYVLTKDEGQTRLELIQEDNRPNAFAPGTLMPILESLKKIAETN